MKFATQPSSTGNSGIPGSMTDGRSPSLSLASIAAELHVESAVAGALQPLPRPGFARNIIFQQTLEPQQALWFMYGVKAVPFTSEVLPLHSRGCFS
jgi:hypothetical protein